MLIVPWLVCALLFLAAFRRQWTLPPDRVRAQMERAAQGLSKSAGLVYDKRKERLVEGEG